MADNPKKTISVYTTDTTETFTYLNQRHGRAPVITLIRATAGHASSKLTHYIPEAAFKVKFAADATNVATTYYLVADVASGHLVNGHTVTTSDYILMPGSNGWVCKAITGVTDDTGYSYFHITVGTTSGRAVTTEESCYIIRSTMVHDLTVGSTSIEKTEWFTQDVGTPVVFSATSGDTTDVTALVSVEFEDPA